MSQATELPRTEVRGLRTRQTGGFSPRDIHARGEAYPLPQDDAGFHRPYVAWQCHGVPRAGGNPGGAWRMFYLGRPTLKRPCRLVKPACPARSLKLDLNTKVLDLSILVGAGDGMQQAAGRDRVHDAGPCRRWVNQDNRSTVCQESWLASVAATAYIRMGLVRSTTASIKAEAIRVNPEEAPEPSRPGTGLAAMPRFWRVQFQSRARTSVGLHKSPCDACPGFASPRSTGESIDSEPR